jgi:hypothetical protein
MGMGNQSDPIGGTTKSLVPSDSPIESALGQSQGASSQDHKAIRGRKLGSIVVPRESIDSNRSARAWRARGETMTRGKPGEGLRGGHRRRAPRTTIGREDLNSPRVSSDRGANLADRLHPIRDRVGSSLQMRRAKAAVEATVAIRKETGTKASAVDQYCSGGGPAADSPLRR